MPRAPQELLNELLNDYQKGPDEYVVSKWIVEKIPALFNNDMELYRRTKLLIANKLGIDSCSVVFVGSSCTGFSLNPEKNCKLFDEESDIDIAIISHYHFTEAWHWLRTQKLSLLHGAAKKAYKSHRSFYVFDGTIATDMILKFMPFGAVWQEAIEELQKEPVFGKREIHFRLYQDHKSLVDYHVKNISENLGNLLGVAAENQILQ